MNKNQQILFCAFFIGLITSIAVSFIGIENSLNKIAQYSCKGD